jgi:hypothetical protein
MAETLSCYVLFCSLTAFMIPFMVPPFKADRLLELLINNRDYGGF